jgi:hypothetical protein
MTRLRSARTLAATLLLVATAAGAGLVTFIPAAAAMQLGGFRAISTDDPAVQGAGAFLAEQAGGELASVDSAQYQSTANTNYRLEITLSDGARWSGQITRDRTSGEYSMMGSPTQLSGETDTGTNDGSDHSGDDDD